jgi:hypothetical protein
MLAVSFPVHEGFAFVGSLGALHLTFDFPSDTVVSYNISGNVEWMKTGERMNRQQTVLRKISCFSSGL